jgi:sucrose-6-phosphate hydrolase SacC (GH32 family)
MSVPRVLALRTTANGLRLVQSPIAELTQLEAGAPAVFAGGSLAAAADWLSAKGAATTCLDLDLEFNQVGPDTPVALELVTGSGEVTAIQFDFGRGQLRLDRTRSRPGSFHPRFSGSYAAPLQAKSGRCDLRLLLDAASLEIFAQNGETALTSTIFPSGADRAWRLVATGAKAPGVSRIAWRPLRSVWRP